MAFERLKDKETFKQAYLDMLDKTYSKPAAECTDWEKYEALVYLFNKDAGLRAYYKAGKPKKGKYLE